MKMYQQLLLASLVLSILGVINAGYLTYTATLGISPVCNLTSGCDLVAASPYSRVFGIPLSLFGVFFYLVMAGFSGWGMMQKTVSVRWFMFPAATLGFLLSLYFLYLQAFVINAFCQYCLFSLAEAAALFVFSLLILRVSHRIREAPSTSVPE